MAGYNAASRISRVVSILLVDFPRLLLDLDNQLRREGAQLFRAEGVEVGGRVHAGQHARTPGTVEAKLLSGGVVGHNGRSGHANSVRSRTAAFRNVDRSKPVGRARSGQARGLTPNAPGIGSLLPLARNATFRASCVSGEMRLARRSAHA